jgi:hypothetical protein
MMLGRFEKTILSALLVVVLSFSFFKVVHVNSEINQQEILNYLDYNLNRGENIGLLDFVFTLDSYDVLGVAVPYRTQIIEYLDSMQSSDGTWATGQNHYVPITAQVLMFYNRSGVRPAKSLEPFFSTIDTWQKVVNHVQIYDPDNVWGGLWGYVTSYVVYKGERPPWTNEFLDAVNSSFDTWANSNHQRTHLMMNLFQLGALVPRINDVVNIALYQQNGDGSWDDDSAETAFMIGTFELIRKQTTIDQSLIDSAISRGLIFLESCYRRIESGGKFYGGFASNSSELNLKPQATALGAYSLLNPESNVWLRWFARMRTYTFDVSWQASNYTIIAVSNSTVTNLSFNYSQKQLSFNVTGLPATTGYCNISIPKTFMWCDSPSQWNVTVNGSPINSLKTAEDTNTYLYFTYDHSAHEVIIKSVYAIPEFPSALTLLPIMLIILLGVVIATKRPPRD